MKTVAIAGATGFIGKKLIDKILLESDYKIIALSRNIIDFKSERVISRKCDLFSVLDIENGIEGADILVYLVHSMQPSARLDQASFSDYDLILADNFGRAARKMQINKVIYLGGILPSGSDLSKHLLSRLEVEDALKEYITDYVIFRAGLILGGKGSSFNLLLNLVNRLPILICPLWSANLCSPIHVDNVVDSIVLAIINDKYYHNDFDLASDNSISYYNLLKLTAKNLKLKRVFFRFPFSAISVSRFWVSLFSGASKYLVYPLLDSLKHSLLPRSEKQFILPNNRLYSVEKALELSIQDSKNINYSFKRREVNRSTVRSVQRATLPFGFSAEAVAIEYMSWIPKFCSPFIKVSVHENLIEFSFLLRRFKLLVLERSLQRSTPDRQLFYIKGGALAATQDRGRLEFREVLNKNYILIAIHDFYPSLPWYIYCYTQALVHLFVMKSFTKHLQRLNKI